MLADRVQDEQDALDKERERIKQETKKKQQQFLEKSNTKKNLLKKNIESDLKHKADANVGHVSKSSKASAVEFGRKDCHIEFKTGGG